MDSKKMIAGLLAGAAIGVAIGLLLAPKRSEKASVRLVKGSKRLADNLKGTVEDSVQALRERFDSGVEELVKNGREMISKATERVSN